MSFTPPREQLCGLSLQNAELYGKPNVGAYYKSKSVKSHKKEEDALCTVCRRQAQSVHHVPPLSKGHEFVLRTINGEFRLKPSLFALCGDGTTGCHNDFHGGARYVPNWVWNSDENALLWWGGELLALYGAHSPALYRFGFWEITNKEDNSTIIYRGYE